MPIEIAGVKVIPFTNKEQLMSCVFDLRGNVVPGMAVAVNPEKVIKAMDDAETLNIINSATIQYADGIGVVKALEQKTKAKLERIAGCELWLDILKRSVSHRSKVLLIGAKQSVIDDCEAKLKACEVNIVAAQNGYFNDIDTVIELVKGTQPDIVIVAQGSPKQEKLINQLRTYWPHAFYMGVGGSFDVLAGAVQRAPKTWQKLNLEWLYRVVKEPKRIFRQANLFRFLLLYITRKL
ncbi:WecB/TagA/CpsF family glycosyltransferase [Pseudoalteromonas sp. CnMc7-15]|uniref:WecB/TagA/CpsF family glycosyltransferase n=1 Tax=unclassified Pseudoalteromonas TaxID=194690 RepID=UPI001EF4812F|nr:WecB/TagA/CpsF family glycosyltransferase [Pseudoalteromonas sp. CnMc7-15]MCG7566506.1 WecB/TagA/CpsF family glycosyltransferase [Pseudoalteromonas sp. CnMc7-15]